MALAAVASAAVLIRLADASALAVSFWRTAGGAVLLAAPAWRVRQSLSRSQVMRIGAAGLALAAHFWLWLASLDRTTVAASTVLVTTAPLFIALIRTLGGRRLGGRTVVALGVAFAGVAVIAGGDIGLSGPELAGDGLALSGGLAVAFYLLLGESLTRELDNWLYSALTYATAAVLLAVALVTTGTDSGLGGGYSTKTWLAIGAMILGPQVLGHTLVNRLLSTLGSLTVSMSLLLEPVVAGLLAWVVLAEPPTRRVWLGAPLVLAGVARHLYSTASRLDGGGLRP